MTLRNPETRELVDGGARIPLDQILSGPRRARVEFEGESEVRGVGAMLRKESLAGADPVGVIQRKAGRRTGWGPLAAGAFVAYQTVNEGPRSRELTIGRVLVNHREERRATLRPYRGCWRGVQVAHIPQCNLRTFPSIRLATATRMRSVRTKPVSQCVMRPWCFKWNCVPGVGWTIAPLGASLTEAGGCSLNLRRMWRSSDVLGRVRRALSVQVAWL